MKTTFAQYLNETPINLPYQHIEFDYEPSNQILWGYMNSKRIPNFGLEILNEMNQFDKEFKRNKAHIIQADGSSAKVSFYVAASKTPSVFSLGGDLDLFLTAIKAGDRLGLARYAHLCIDNLYSRLRNYDADVTTIGLIQGDALGGGFEMALANDFIVAEEGSRMGFPEILFNLFPGMGALSLLARKIGLIQARRIVSEGRIYTAETLFSLGVVDAVVEKGRGEKFIRDYIQRNEKRWNGLQAIRTSCQVIDPIQRAELINIANIWVDAALKLNTKDLSMMEKLNLTQKKRFSPQVNIAIVKDALEEAI